MSRVLDLNDHCFVLASELLREVCDAFEDEIGGPPSPLELYEILEWGIRGCGADLAGVDASDVASLSIKMRAPKAPRAKIGDVLAVPSRSSTRHHFLLYLGDFGHFGSAFGVFRGARPLGPAAISGTEFLRCHLFSDQDLIKAGRWQNAGQRPDLVARFPPDPEYFHPKRDHSENPDIGPYGCAETPYAKDGSGSRLRQLDEAESSQLGLTREHFRMHVSSDQMSDHLDRINVTTQAWRDPSDDEGGEPDSA